ncbi:MAG: HD domain-containing protein, partial [Bacteroidota bacterium]
MDNQERNKVFLAALLHDIGKFLQRADPSASGKSTMLSDGVKKSKQTFCPESKNGQYFTHKHVLYTAQFFSEHEGLFKEIFQWSDKQANELKGGDTLIRLAAAHHKPSSELEKLIQQADHYASGVDRTEKEGQKDAEHERKWDDFKRTRMRSIMEAIRTEVEKDSSVEYEYHLPLTSFSLSGDTFPRPGDIKQDQAPYQQLWDEFSTEVHKLGDQSIQSLPDTLLFLLEKYTSRIPSSTQHLTDVSLYDHLKTTAAFALCLYDVQKSGVSPENKFLLVGGDVSGIQSYIYDIISKYAAKNLKGRSFYIQMLVDAILSHTLQSLNLYRA